MNQDKQIISVEAVQDYKIKVDKLFQEFQKGNYHITTFWEDVRNLLNQFQNPPPTKCTCERTGETEMLVMCCNICGKPEDGAIGRMGGAKIKMPSEEDLVNALELKKYQLYYEDHAFSEGANYVIDYIKQQGK